jgi:hypothetical protein
MNESTREKHLVELKYKQKVYLQSLYDEKGGLKKNTSGEVLPLCGLFPLYSEEYKRYHLLAYQRITGLNPADTLGYMVTRLNWNGYEFQTIDVSTSIMPLSNN